MDLIFCTAEKLNKSADKQIFCFGAGGNIINCLSAFHDMEFTKKIICTTDNNPKLWGTKIESHGVTINVLSVNDWLNSLSDDAAILITSNYYKEIFAQIRSYGIKNICYKFPEMRYDFMMKIENEAKKRPVTNTLVFRSDTDYSDNARVLFEYMLEHEFNKKYMLVWAVEDAEKYKHLENIPNVRVYTYSLTNLRSHYVAEEYFKYKYTAKVFFVTHNFEWLKGLNEGQIICNLWHGCGFKNDTVKKYSETDFHYTCVSGDIYKCAHAAYFNCRQDQVLVTGLPKDDLFFTADPASIRPKLPCTQSKKIVVWMPTYRQSSRMGLGEYTAPSETGLTLIRTIDQLIKLDTWLKANDAVMIIKLHQFQDKSFITNMSMSNIYVWDNDKLHEYNIQPNELLRISECLITDYSSTAVDYLCTDNPMAFALDDLPVFRQGRIFLFEPIEDYLPGVLLNTDDDLLVFLDDVLNKKRDSGKQKRDRLAKIMMKYKDGNACRRIIDFLAL